MKNYFAPADIVRYTAPYAVNPGDGMLVGGLFGVACTTAASGEKTDVSTEGMYYLTSVSAETAAEGAAAYWDAGNRRVSVTTGTGIGHFPYGKGAGETSTRVRLQASPGSVSGAWKLRTLTKVLGLEETIFCQLDNGTYVGTARLPEAIGFYGAQLFTATGDLAALAKTGQLATLATGLKTAGGATITGGTVFGAWGTPENNVLFCVQSNGGATNTKAYLYFAKNTGGVLTVGNNAPNYDNGNAILNIGERAGVHPGLIRTAHARSICWARIGGAMVGFFNEYNVNNGRTAGGTNDQVRVMRTDDFGKTWTVFLEFNTNGSRQVRHGHAVVQDPRTGYVYFIFGDDPESGIIRWDGVAAVPPANTAVAAFNNYPGWGGLYTSGPLNDLYRSSDMLFSGEVGAYLIDRVTSPLFHRSMNISRDGPFVSTKGPPVDTSALRDPIFGCLIPGGGAIWISMWDTSIAGATRGYDVWSSVDLVSWVKIGSIPDLGTVGTVGLLFNLFWTKDSRLLLSIASGSSKLVDGVNAYGGTLVFTADEYFDGTATVLA